ncbi:MAG: hypothetical protein V9E90_03520 [Saprospiraceae bacterium]
MRKYSSLLVIISMQLDIMSSFAIASDVKTDICDTAFNVVAAAVVSRNSGTPKDDVKKKWLASVEKNVPTNLQNNELNNYFLQLIDFVYNEPIGSKNIPERAKTACLSANWK